MFNSFRVFFVVNGQNLVDGHFLGGTCVVGKLQFDLSSGHADDVARHADLERPNGVHRVGGGADDQTQRDGPDANGQPSKSAMAGPQLPVLARGIRFPTLNNPTFTHGSFPLFLVSEGMGCFAASAVA